MKMKPQPLEIQNMDSFIKEYEWSLKKIIPDLNILLISY